MGAYSRDTHEASRIPGAKIEAFPFYTSAIVPPFQYRLTTAQRRSKSVFAARFGVRAFLHIYHFFGYTRLQDSDYA